MAKVIAFIQGVKLRGIGKLKMVGENHFTYQDRLLDIRNFGQLKEINLDAVELSTLPKFYLQKTKAVKKRIIKKIKPNKKAIVFTNADLLTLLGRK